MSTPTVLALTISLAVVSIFDCFTADSFNADNINVDSFGAGSVNMDTFNAVNVNADSSSLNGDTVKCPYQPMQTTCLAINIATET